MHKKLFRGQIQFYLRILGNDWKTCSHFEYLENCAALMYLGNELERILLFICGEKHSHGVTQLVVRHHGVNLCIVWPSHSQCHLRCFGGKVLAFSKVNSTRKKRFQIVNEIKENVTRTLISKVDFTDCRVVWRD